MHYQLLSRTSHWYWLVESAEHHILSPESCISFRMYILMKYYLKFFFHISRIRRLFIDIIIPVNTAFIICYHDKNSIITYLRSSPLWTFEIHVQFQNWQGPYISLGKNYGRWTNPNLQICSMVPSKTESSDVFLAFRVIYLKYVYTNSTSKNSQYYELSWNNLS